MIVRNTIPTYDELAIRESPYCPYKPKPADRTLVLLDLRNISKKLFNDYPDEDFDFRKLLMDAVGIRDCVAAIAVDGTFYEEEDRRTRLQTEIGNSGFRLDLVPASNGSGKQEGTDVEIALVAYDYAVEKRCDCVLLITGDGDFSPLVRRLHEKGIIVEVISFEDCLSGCLEKTADKVRLIDRMPLIRIRPDECEEADL